MGLFFKDAKDLAKQASIDANVAENTLHECTKRLKEIEEHLFSISKKVTPQTPRHAVAPLAKTMQHFRINSERTLISLNRLQKEIEKIKIK